MIGCINCRHNLLNSPINLFEIKTRCFDSYSAIFISGVIIKQYVIHLLI